MQKARRRNLTPREQYERQGSNSNSVYNDANVTNDRDNSNKCDGDLDPSRRAITTATAKRWCQLNGDITYFETSARDSINVDTAFEYIAQQAFRERKNQQAQDEMALPDPMRVKRVGAQPKQEEKKNCPC